MALRTHDYPDLELDVADARSANDRPLAIGTALPIIVGASIVLWLLIGFGLRSLL